MIRILSTGPLNTIQDLGRLGFRRIGLARGGAMDPLALSVGNILLGNPANAAAIEVQMMPFELTFLADTSFSVTGADCEATLDGLRIPDWWCMSARAGQQLRLAAPRNGMRAYLCFAGGIDVPPVLGGRGTYLRDNFGGFEGRMLQAGDRLPLGKGDGPPVTDAQGYGTCPPAEMLASPGAAGESDIAVRAIVGSEFHEFDSAAQRSFFEDSWAATMENNRQGIRFEGPVLRRNEAYEMRSHGIVAGVVQVPHAGKPLIQLADSNSAGGYPKIAVVIEADLWRLGQLSPGKTARFIRCTRTEAVGAKAELSAYLDRLKGAADLYRSGSTRVAS